MKHYQYLIVGGGLAGDAAVRGIRELDRAGSIGMLSAEPDPPYLRPALSKGLWKGKPLEKIWRGTEQLGVELHLGHKVTQLDLAARRVVDEAKYEYTYEKMLLATGASPKHLPCGGDIIYFRNLQDYRRLRALSERGSAFAVIGAGFIGSELAAALVTAGRKVTMISTEDGIGAKIFPAALSQYLNEYYRQKGVEILVGDAVEIVKKSKQRIRVLSRSGRSLEVDGVVAGIGVRPNVDLAQAAGLRIDDGILVDEYLRSSADDVYAAGDVANFHHSALDRRLRVEHEDNAVSMGRLAGRNMAGAGEIYTHVPMFYSDLFELGYEAVGDLDSSLETVADWNDPFKQGVVYYLEHGRVRGVLLWNVWKQVDRARLLLKQPGPFTAADLKSGGLAVTIPGSMEMIQPANP